MLAAKADLSIPGIYGQRIKTNEGAKKKCPAPTASTVGSCGQYRQRSNAKRSTAANLINCIQEGMLELDGHVGQCLSRFPTVSERSWGEWGQGEGEEEKYEIDRKSKIKQLHTAPTSRAGMCVA